MAKHPSRPTGRHGRGNGLTERNVPSFSGLSRTSTSLLRKAKAHDEAGWAQLVDTYGAMIYSWCRRDGLRPEDAKDVCQEVLVAIWRKIGDLRRDRPGDGFRKWIHTITVKKICDHWRGAKKQRIGIGGTTWLDQVSAIAESLSAEDPSTWAALEHDEQAQHQIIAQARSEVTERDWNIFERLVIEDRLPAEVAEEFGISRNTVYLVKSRMLKRLRSYGAR